MLGFTVLVVIAIVWLADRADFRRRLDRLERELRELKLEAKQESGRASANVAAAPPAAPVTEAAVSSPPAIRTPTRVTADVPTRSEWIAPTPEASVRPAQRPASPAAEGGISRLWQLISGGNPIVRCCSNFQATEPSDTRYAITGFPNGGSVIGGVS